MTLTIQLSDSQVAQLTKKALSTQQPVEELAAQLLGDVIEQFDETEHWAEQNQRRLALIRKSVGAKLTNGEQTELDSLQSVLDQRLESVDNQLLDTLDDMKQAVAGLSHS